jgi:hypothetical protein
METRFANCPRKLPELAARFRAAILLNGFSFDSQNPITFVSRAEEL